MSENTKQLLIITIGLILLVAMLIGSITYAGVVNVETQRTCLEQGNSPEDC